MPITPMVAITRRLSYQKILLLGVAMPVGALLATAAICIFVCGMLELIKENRGTKVIKRCDGDMGLRYPYLLHFHQTVSYRLLLNGETASNHLSVS